jgi:quercetin dioxygenase-like cupin family protein
MTKVRITTPEQKPWQVSGERVETELSRVIQDDGGAWSAYKIREPGTETELQLVELRFHPGEVTELHCHDEDELIYILSGSMIVNNRTLGPGTTMYIGGNVFYGFTAGPEGLHFLNFRGHIDNSFHLPGRRKIVDTSVSH